CRQRPRTRRAGRNRRPRRRARDCQCDVRRDRPPHPPPAPVGAAAVTDVGAPLMTLPPNHPPVAAPRVGVLLVNLGTPDAPDARSVRRYLAQFLSDRRVVEIPQILWQPILRGLILTTRPKKSAHAYAQVWTNEGSPLAAITRAQSDALQRALGERTMVAHAMRYGGPAIGPAIDALVAAGCRRILVAPLYPQYCAATTATVVDAVGDHLKTLRWQPTLRFLPPYHDDPAYLDALRASVEA